MRSLLLGVAVAVAAVAASAWAAGFAIDFSVYWTAALAHIRDGGALYGPEAVTQWPMAYRYPPLFVWLIYPLALLPFRAGAFVWALGKCAVLAALIRSLDVSRLTWRTGFLAAALAGPYVLLEIRFGNAQFYVFALVAATLLVVRRRPGVAAGALGLATALKVWPLFFVPYLALRGFWRVAAGALGTAAALTLAPTLWTGWDAHLERLAAWYGQESAIAADAGRMWFPSQSLLGVLTRHLTFVDWSGAPDPSYPEVNWLALDPDVVRIVWLVLVIFGYRTLLVLARRLPAERDRLLHGVAFCALVLLQPYAQREIALTVLLWPALVVAAAPKPRWGEAVFTAAAAISLTQVLLSPSWQRAYLALGGDCLVVLLLSAAGIGALISVRSRNETGRRDQAAASPPPSHGRGRESAG